MFDAMFTSKNVRMVEITLAFLCLMDQTLMKPATRMAPVSTQQAPPTPMGAAALLS